MPDLLVIMKALSDETRLTLVKVLLEHDFCVGALARRLSVSESAVSQHLKLLRSAGLVKGEKRGYFTHYSVDRERLSWAANELLLLSDIEQVKKACQKNVASDKGCHHHSSADHDPSNQKI